VLALAQGAKERGTRYNAREVQQHAPALAGKPCTRHGKPVGHTHAECDWLKRALADKGAKGDK